MIRKQRCSILLDGSLLCYIPLLSSLFFSLIGINNAEESLKEHNENIQRLLSKIKINETLPIWYSRKELNLSKAGKSGPIKVSSNNRSVKQSYQLNESNVEINENAQYFSEKWHKLVTYEQSRGDRHNINSPVDYGDFHPFEILRRSRRQLFHETSLNGTVSDLNDETESSPFLKGLYESTRRLQKLPWQPNSVYEPIRITLDTHHIEKLGPMYSEKVEFLKNQVFPVVSKFWSSALRVFPSTSGIIIDDRFCPVSDVSQTIDGVSDSDFVIFFGANVPGICDHGASAAARSCQSDQYDRPTVGTAIVCLDQLDINDEASKNLLIRIITHEFAHVFGMRSIDLAYFYNPATGYPRTARPFKKERVTCVDGFTSEIVLPSPDTIASGFTKRGLRYFEITTPTVRQVVRNQFDCQSMTGARLENQPTNDGNCFGTHWEARLFAVDMMSAFSTSSVQYLTPLTLALFEDSGWYKAHYTTSSTSPFGFGAGCDFVYEDCIKDGVVPNWAKGHFCSDPGDTLQCDATNQNIARCNLVDYNDYLNAVPPTDQYQYFGPGKETWGGILHTADYCPMYTAATTNNGKDDKKETILMNCNDARLESPVVQETFGESSKCYNTNLSRPVCMKTVCDTTAGKVNVIVMDSDGNYMPPQVCEADGDWMNIPGLGDGSKFECPRFNSICSDVFCPSDCAGRGICDFSAKFPKCECCNKDDKSFDCRLSQLCEMKSNNNKEQLYPSNSDNGEETQPPFSSTNDVGEKNDIPTNSDNGGKNFCGSSLEDASQCQKGKECVSSSRDCGSVQWCYEDVHCNKDEETSSYNDNNNDNEKNKINDNDKANHENYYDNKNSNENNSNNDNNDNNSNNAIPSNYEDGEEQIIITESDNENMKFCGSSFGDASQCKGGEECASGSSRSCGRGQTCYVVMGCEEKASTYNFCGISYAEASMCNENNECPSGSNFECIGFQSCFTVSSCPNFNEGDTIFNNKDKDTSTGYTDGNDGGINVDVNNDTSNNNDNEKDANNYNSIDNDNNNNNNNNNSDNNNNNDNDNDNNNNNNNDNYNNDNDNNYNNDINNKGDNSNDNSDNSSNNNNSNQISKNSYYCGTRKNDAKKCITSCSQRLDTLCPFGETCFSGIICEIVTTQTEPAKLEASLLVPPSISPVSLPSSLPSMNPRQLTQVVYNFCLEHETLTPVYYLVRETDKSIQLLLTGLFQDDEKLDGNPFEFSEKDIIVDSVKTIWIPEPPDENKCDCIAGDGISQCSAVASTVVVSHWAEIDKKDIRFLLLLLRNHFTNGMKYRATNFGLASKSAKIMLALSGIPNSPVSDESRKLLEETIRNVLNNEILNLNVRGLAVLSVSVKSVSKAITGRLLGDDNSYSSEGVEIDVTEVEIAAFAEYVPPPDIDLEKLLDVAADAAYDDIIHNLKESGDPFFNGIKSSKIPIGDLSLESVFEPSTSPYDDGQLSSAPSGSWPTKSFIDPEEKSISDPEIDDTVDSGESSKVGIIFGILFGILSLGAATIFCFIYLQKKKNKVANSGPSKDLFEIQPPNGFNMFSRRDSTDDFTVDTSHYTGASKSASNLSDAASRITDPTYRGGKVPTESMYDNNTYASRQEEGSYTSRGDYDETSKDFDEESASSYSMQENSYQDDRGENLRQSLQYYQETIQEEDDDDGTFAGQSIIPYFDDDISALPSLIGVEDVRHFKEQNDESSHVSRDNIPDEESEHNVSALPSMTGVEDTWFDNKQNDESSYISRNNRTDEESVYKSNSADEKETGELSVLSSTSDNSNASSFSNNLTSSVYSSFSRPTAPSVARSSFSRQSATSSVLSATAPSVARSSFSRQSATSSVLSDDFSDLRSMASSSMYSTAHTKFSKQTASTAALSHDFTNSSQAASSQSQTPFFSECQKIQDHNDKFVLATVPEVTEDLVVQSSGLIINQDPQSLQKNNDDIIRFDNETAKEQSYLTHSTLEPSKTSIVSKACRDDEVVPIDDSDITKEINQNALTMGHINSNIIEGEEVTENMISFSDSGMKTNRPSTVFNDEDSSVISTEEARKGNYETSSIHMQNALEVKLNESLQVNDTLSKSKQEDDEEISSSLNNNRIQEVSLSPQQGSNLSEFNEERTSYTIVPYDPSDSSDKIRKVIVNDDEVAKEFSKLSSSDPGVNTTFDSELKDIAIIKKTSPSSSSIFTINENSAIPLSMMKNLDSPIPPELIMEGNTNKLDSHHNYLRPPSSIETTEKEFVGEKEKIIGTGSSSRSVHSESNDTLVTNGTILTNGTQYSID